MADPSLEAFCHNPHILPCLSLCAKVILPAVRGYHGKPAF
jgi:hypothetical protein